MANADLAEYVDALWLVVVTIVTVGYGDCVVVGFPGRLCVVLGGVVGGAAICSMCRVVVVGALTITPNERDVIDIITERTQTTERRSVAVRLIQAEWRRYKAMTVGPPTDGLPSRRDGVAFTVHKANVLKFK
ncbi:hypothetical protein B5M09_007526 [Aphanomyces astaci]|nr:hypothetical protein B5M09_007526 [Aphanomyces astaci]